MILCRAAWVLPIAAPPIRNGWVAVDDGRIVAYGEPGEPAPDGEATTLEFAERAVLPGLVNAHTHLELSHMRHRVPPSGTMVAWVRALMAERRSQPENAEVARGVAQGIAEALASGTAVVGDISNTLATVGPLARSGLSGIVFYELLGFNPAEPAAAVERACRSIGELECAPGLRLSLAAHAPYSTSPAIFQAIADAVDREQLPACSVHLAESREEVEFVRSGEGAWRQLLVDFGVWNATWRAPGVGPVQYLDRLGFLRTNLLAVHGVQMTADDLEILHQRGTTLVACPRSNRHTGAGAPPIDLFYRSGAAIAVGTDSLASVADLNLFSELAAMRALAPEVPAARLLESATAVGARALALGGEFGTIERGKRARLIAVTVPPSISDVEEYLVSGIQPEQISWIGTS